MSKNAALFPPSSPRVAEPEGRPRSRELSAEIETFLRGGRCFLLAKGRVALYVGLRALGLPAGSKVLMPGYTCMVVPSAVQYAGLKPVYLDIDPRSFNLDPVLLEQIPAGDVSAIIVQHTYGIPAAMESITAWAARHRVPVIEDCCHTFGTPIDGRPCGTFGSFAFMSGQWNKPFSTGLGGMLLVNDPSLPDRVKDLLEKEAVRPGWLKRLVLRGQILAHERLVSPATSARMTDLYRALTRWGLAAGSSSPEELMGRRPKKYLTTMAPCQVRQGLDQVARIQENLRHRAGLTAFYHRELSRLGFAAVSLTEGPMPLLRYPVRVANKTEVLALARRERLEIGSWFDAPLHPAGTCLQDFGYRAGSCPAGEAASVSVVNLPTHVGVSAELAERHLQFLRRQARPSGDHR